jgi:penicillin amidase
MHTDVLSPFARDLVPLLLTTPAQTAEEKEALASLARWDFRELPSSADGALFTVWYSHLMPALFRDEAGTEIKRYWSVHRPDVMLAALRDPSGALCEDVTTSGHESCGDILLRTLRESLEELHQRLGPDRQGWRLDALRVARFENPVGSSVPVLDKLFTRARGVGGDPYTVRVSSYWLDSPYDVRLFQSYVGQFELPGPSRGLIALGQSGHPLSPHFDDLLPGWLDGRPPPMPEASATGSKELTLVPASGVAHE